MGGVEPCWLARYVAVMPLLGVADPTTEIISAAPSARRRREGEAKEGESF